MFGAYQAGAWSVLSREFAPDMVVGASVGALNGWMIAGGATPEALIETWLDPASGDLMRYRVPPSPWGGWFDPNPLRERARHLVAGYRPRVAFGAAMLRLPWLKPVLARSPDVDWQHLVASCSVPGGFPPVRIGRGLYCDGGLLDTTPIWAAAAMGADRVIAVNASRFIPPRSVHAIVVGIKRLRERRQPAVSGGADVTLITPKDYLGVMLDGADWRRDRIERWIELGAADARGAFSGLADLKPMLSRQGRMS